MIRVFALFSVLAVPTVQQNAQHTQDTPQSPCPNVFMYEPPGSEPGRWYGVVNLSTDSTLHSLWLNIVLDSKADILGNWIGDVSTQDNKDFKVENTDMKISPGPAVPVRFFVQYNPLKPAPRLQAIRMNGREICNANTPRPALENVEPTRLTRPETNKPTTKKPQLRPQDIPQTRPIQATSNEEIRPIYIEPINAKPVLSPRPTYIDSSDASSQSVNSKRPQLTTARPTRGPNRRPGHLDYDDDVSTGDSEDYFQGGPVLVKPITGTITTNTNTQAQNQCGRVVLNNAVPLIVNGTPTLEGQWPWQIALYQTQTVDNKYICGGTLVSHRHVITAAHCVTRKGSRKVVNQNTLTVFLGKHNLRTSVDGVQIRFVDDIVAHPEYNATTFSRDIAILRLKEPVSYTDWVRPACLWPENLIDLTNVIGKRGSVVGWGFDDTGVATEELSLVQMPVVDTETCIRSYSEFFVRFTSEYTYCAGYRDGSSVCNGDSGGGMVFKTGNTWYLRGLVSLSVSRQNEYKCDPTHYVIFTDIAKFLPWIRQHVSDY